ncbi:hypothetical protein EII17_02375 [Clostridiales bacterium COT073_COT-073]|nr:hypothetical protein EII17_02375 [Clostridiales bacterium COT073_COT-073]
MKQNTIKLMTNLNKAKAGTASMFFLALILSGGILIKQEKNSFLMILYFVCALIVFFNFLFFLKKLRTKSAILEIDDRGIMDNSSALALGVVPWEDIKIVRITSFWGTKYIGLDLIDEQKYYQKYFWLKRIIAELNKKLGMASINISLELAGQKVDDIYPQIMEIQKQWQATKALAELETGRKANK